MPEDSPIRPTDDQARDLAKSLLTNASFAALAVNDANGFPLVTRIAFAIGPRGDAVTLVSDLSAHTQALYSNPECSVLVGEPQEKGDPLTHPRLSIQARARFVDREDPYRKELAKHYLLVRPKAKIYIGFADFNFIVFDPVRAFLNGGFGQAFELTPTDLGCRE